MSLPCHNRFAPLADDWDDDFSGGMDEFFSWDALEAMSIEAASGQDEFFWWDELEAIFEAHEPLNGLDEFFDFCKLDSLYDEMQPMSLADCAIMPRLSWFDEYTKMVDSVAKAMSPGDCRHPSRHPKKVRRPLRDMRSMRKRKRDARTQETWVWVPVGSCPQHRDELLVRRLREKILHMELLRSRAMGSFLRPGSGLLAFFFCETVFIRVSQGENGLCESF